MKRASTFLVALALAASVSHTWAHGGHKPQHGGVVQVASDLQFELVRAEQGVVIHVTDHGKPKSTANASGKLTVLNKGTKTESALTAADGNTLKADIGKLQPGSKVVAAIQFSATEVVTVRFVIK